MKINLLHLSLPGKNTSPNPLPKGARYNIRDSILFARVATLLVFFFIFTFHSSLFTAALASEKWQGVDETVVEKVAKEHGRGAIKPLINTDQGDLLLFVFLVAGAAGGFVAGYSWRMLLEKKSKDKG